MKRVVLIYDTNALMDGWMVDLRAILPAEVSIEEAESEVRFEVVIPVEILEEISKHLQEEGDKRKKAALARNIRNDWRSNAERRYDYSEPSLKGTIKPFESGDPLGADSLVDKLLLGFAIDASQSRSAVVFILSADGGIVGDTHAIRERMGLPVHSLNIGGPQGDQPLRTVVGEALSDQICRKREALEKFKLRRSAICNEQMRAALSIARARIPPPRLKKKPFWGSEKQYKSPEELREVFSSGARVILNHVLGLDDEQLLKRATYEHLEAQSKLVWEQCTIRYGYEYPAAVIIWMVVRNYVEEKNGGYSGSIGYETGWACASAFDYLVPDARRRFRDYWQKMSPPKQGLIRALRPWFLRYDILRAIFGGNDAAVRHMASGLLIGCLTLQEVMTETHERMINLHDYDPIEDYMKWVQELIGLARSSGLRCLQDV
jgi:hypothetical protein